MAAKGKARGQKNNGSGFFSSLPGLALFLLAALSLAVSCGVLGQGTFISEIFAGLGLWQYLLPPVLALLGVKLLPKRRRAVGSKADSVVDIDEVRARALAKEQEEKRPFFKLQDGDAKVAASKKRRQASVYQKEEFADFADGIKKESPFKRILSFGAQDKGVYGQEPEKELLANDPVQPPEWLESKPQGRGGVNRVLRPVIDYDNGSTAGSEAEKATAANTQAMQEESIISDAQTKPEKNSARSIIKNTYRFGEPDQPRFTYIDTDDVREVAAAGEEAPWHAVPQTYANKEEISDTTVDFAAVQNAKAAAPVSDGQQEEIADASADTQQKDLAAALADVQEKMLAASQSLEQSAANQAAMGAQDAAAQQGNTDEAQTNGEAQEPSEEQGYRLPPLELLNLPATTDPAAYESDIRSQCAVLEQTLADFRVKARVTAVTRGPSVTRFELEPAPGVKVASVVNLADDIALRLAASGVRIEAPIPGKSAIGVEAPNTKNDSVSLREVVEAENVRRDASKLCVGLGKDISGHIITADLAKMPHMLVAGSTGSGKSVCINTLIAGILYKATPDEVKLILVDPKVVELTNYNGIPHLLTPVVTEPKKAASALHWAVVEMERRYQVFAESHVREIKSYNAQTESKLPYIVIIIDELSDLMMVAKADVEDAILRLAQKARAAGIHLVIATQRPSVDVITGIVKANIPSRIAFAVSSQTDSRTILDMGGAEKLLGKGDMLFCPIGQNKPTRVQGAFVSDEELARIVDFIVKQSVPVEYSEEVTSQPLASDAKEARDAAKEEGGELQELEDELFEDAVRLVLDMGQASASMLQRRFRIGYTRAARLVDTMEELGIVGQTAGSKPREVIMSRQEAEERFLERQDN